MIDELLEMQKDTFKWLLLITRLVGIVGLTLSLTVDFLVVDVTKARVSPRSYGMLFVILLDLSVRWLVKRHFRLSTWLWTAGFVALLVGLIPWAAAPQFGPLPYAFTLVVVVAGLLISRNATLHVAGLATVLSLTALGVVGFFRSFDPQGLGAILAPLVIAWSVAILGWVASDQLVTALQWTRHAQLKANTQANYLRQSRDELEKSLLIRDNLNMQLQEAHGQVTHRAVQLATVAEVSRHITSLLDLERLLAEVTNLICDKFAYYYSGVFLIDDKSQRLMLRAAGGERGPSLLERGLELAVDETSLNGHAANIAQTQCVNDITMSFHFRPIDLLRDTISELVIPLKIGQRVLGTLDVQSRYVNAFNKDDIVVLEGLADQVTIAIRNTRLYESELVRRQVAETLQEVGRILGSTLELDQVLDRLLEQLAVVVPHNRAAVILQTGDVMRMAAVRGYEDAQRAMGLDIDIRESDVFSQVSHSQQVLLIADVEQFSGWKQVDWLPIDHSWAGAPLIVQDEVIGMLSLTRKERDAFSLDEGEIILTFANQAAIAIHNARLYEKTRTFNQQLEQKVHERTAELEKAYTLLEKMDRNKSDFIGVAAHELRTPLTVMKGYTAMMQSDPTIKTNAFLIEAVDGVLKGTDRLYEIVNSMLDVARIDSQLLDVRPEQVTLDALISRIRQEFAPDLEQRRLTMLVKGLAQLPSIQADPDMLYKVFYNVIINAIKYTPDGGRITVSAHVVEPGEGMQDCVELLVQDSGIGIDPEHHELIFEKFYQTGKVALHSSGKTKFKGGGPGLGLAIARGIVQAHQGRIWVESERHDEENCPGSCFHILLPIAGVEARARILA